MAVVISRAVEEARLEHDLIVVGGGVYGCMLALESARRGLRPMLLERDDFGQHTSGSWLRILHGGLRYLQTLDLPRHVESVLERRWFLRNFPDLVEPLRCVMPLYRRGLRRRWVMSGALGANDALSWYRNRGLRAERRLLAARTLSTDSVLRLAPSVRPGGLHGGALWHDAVTPRPERLLIEVLRWAVAEGAHVANQVEAVGLEQSAGRVSGVRAFDRLARRELLVRAPVVVNCAGPWSEELGAVLDRPVPGLFEPSIAFNVLLDREPDFSGALAIEAPAAGARTHFVHPAYGRILAGTCHAPATEEVSEGPTRSMVESFRDELAEALPGLGLDSAPVLRVFWGRLPVRQRGTVELSRRPVIHHHAEQGGPRGVVSVSGVKFTTARRVALRLLSELEGRGQLRLGAESTSPRPPAAVVPGAEEVRDMGVENVGELVRSFVDHEAATSLDDVLLRRTDWGVHPDAGQALRTLVDRALARVGRASERESE